MSLVCWQRLAAYKTPWNGWKYIWKIFSVTQQFPEVRDSALKLFPLYQHRHICKKSRFLSFLMNVWLWVSWAQFQDLTQRIGKWNLCAPGFGENTFRQISEEALLLPGTTLFIIEWDGNCLFTPAAICVSTSELQQKINDLHRRLGREKEVAKTSGWCLSFPSHPFQPFPLQPGSFAWGSCWICWAQ